MARRALRHLGLAALASVLVAVLVAGLAGCGGGSPAPKAGDPAPGFEVQGLDGTQGRFPDDYRGRVVALRFWADWCPFCRPEMQAIEPVYARLRDSGLTILAVNVAQSPEVAGRFVRDLGISYAVALDPDAEVAGLYGVVGLPITWFVDRQGKIRNQILGEASAETFAGLAESLLREAPP